MRDRKADVAAALVSTTRMCGAPHNGWDKPSAYLAGYLAGVRHVRRQAPKRPRCARHPRYKAVYPPRCDCQQCWLMYRWKS